MFRKGQTKYLNTGYGQVYQSLLRVLLSKCYCKTLTVEGDYYAETGDYFLCGNSPIWSTTVISTRNQLKC